MKRKQQLLKKKLFSDEDDHDNDDNSSGNDNDDDDDQPAIRVQKKTNQSIKRFLDDFPLEKESSSSDDGGGEEYYNTNNKDDNDHRKKKKKKMKYDDKNTDTLTSYSSLGLNITDDHFVIDEIRKKDIPREDGYEYDWTDRNWRKRPFGHKYYDDQLERMKILNKHPDYVFIKTLAGAMSKSPYDLFQEEDINRLLQEQEEQRLRMQLELKRKIVSTEQKVNQLSHLRSNLNNLKQQEREIKENLKGLSFDAKDNVNTIMYGAKSHNIDIYSQSLCYFDGGDNNDVPYHFSFTNVIDLIYLFNTEKVSLKDKKRYLNKRYEESDEDDILVSSLSYKDDDVHDIYLFKVYFTFIGQYSSDSQLQRLQENTINEIPLNESKTQKSISKVDSLRRRVISCEPIVISASMQNIFNEPFKLIKEEYEYYFNSTQKTIDNKKKKNTTIDVEKVFRYMKGEPVEDNFFDINEYVPNDLKTLMDSIFKGKNNTSQLRGVVIQGFFLYKWLKKANWRTVKTQLNNDWREIMMNELKELSNNVFIELRNGFYEYMNDNGILFNIRETMKDVLSITLKDPVNDNNVDQFERFSKGQDIRRSETYILKPKFLKWLIEQEEYDNYEYFASSNFHRYLDLYLRYNRFLYSDLEQLEKKIQETENAIRKTMKIINNISQEREQDSPLERGDTSSVSNPPYKQRKSFTSQPSISGIVMLKEEVVTFINDAYNLVQRYCERLRGLPLHGFHNKAASDAGLMVDFAKFIAALIAENHEIFPDGYKSKHHQELVNKTKVDRMFLLKQYGYSRSYDDEYTIIKYINGTNSAGASRVISFPPSSSSSSSSLLMF